MGSSTIAAVKQMDIDVGVPGIPRIVRHHTDRRAAQVHSRRSSITDSPFFESRLPVGSSARRITGSPAPLAPRRRAAVAAGELARQMFRPMRHADPLERVLTRFGVRRPACRDRERQLDVFEHGVLAIRLKLWKMNPISRLRTRARSDAASSATGRRSGTASGRG